MQIPKTKLLSIYTALLLTSLGGGGLAYELAAAEPVQGVPPIEEIRTIMEQRCDNSPCVSALNALHPDNLNDVLRAIDPYAKYAPPTVLKSDPQLHLGIEVFKYKAALWVRPDLGGPADRAGLPDIGKLLAINGIPVSTSEVSEVATLLEISEKQKRIAITVSDHSGRRVKTYAISSATNHTDSQMWYKTGHRIIIRIPEFISHDTAPKLLAIFRTLVHSDSEVVVDLRGNMGGDLYEAIEIAGMFVPSGSLLATTYDCDGTVRTFQAQSTQILPPPTWLLIDRRTTSAAEVFAAILKYYGIAWVVGERTFGKCVSQEIMPLSDGGYLWLSTLDVRFPDGMTCTGRGVEPDMYLPGIAVEEMSKIIKKIGDYSVIFQKAGAIEKNNAMASGGIQRDRPSEH